MDAGARHDLTMPPKSPPRVLGPYRNRDKYRLIVVDGSSRKSIICSSPAEAEAMRAELTGALRAHSQREIGDALAEFHAYLVAVRGVLPATAAHSHRQLARFLPATAALRTFSAAQAERLYRDETQRTTAQFGRPVSAGTHRALLRRAKQFFQWAKEQGLLAANPFAAVKPVGQVRTGKTQLRIDEARAFLAAALEMAQGGDLGALGCLMMLLLGLRCGEVLARQARDLDDGGTVLWIPRGKTKNARRRLQVPELLQPLLRALALGKAPEQLLFGTNRQGGPRAGMYLWVAVHRVCARAGVPPVCSHSLRGLHSTLALEAGATSTVVASALGHSSFAITARHYADPSTLSNTTARRAAQALGLGGSAGAGPAIAASGVAGIAGLIEQLTDEQRDDLRRLLDASRRPARDR